MTLSVVIKNRVRSIGYYWRCIQSYPKLCVIFLRVLTLILWTKQVHLSTAYIFATAVTVLWFLHAWVFQLSLNNWKRDNSSKNSHSDSLVPRVSHLIAKNRIVVLRTRREKKKIDQRFPRLIPSSEQKSPPFQLLGISPSGFVIVSSCFSLILSLGSCFICVEHNFSPINSLKSFQIRTISTRTIKPLSAETPTPPPWREQK